MVYGSSYMKVLKISSVRYEDISHFVFLLQLKKPGFKMVERKKFSKEELKGIGLRIKASRTLTGLTQEEFGNKYNIPVPSIRTWEFGSVVPRLDGLVKFTDALHESDIYVHTDWLLHGTGTGPSYFLAQHNEASASDESLTDETVAFKELFKKFSKKNKENPIITEINDDEMHPLFKMGDLVAGILMSKDDYKGGDPRKPMLVNLGDGFYILRYLYKVENDFFICSFKNPDIKKVTIESFGNIRWHRSC
jgi:transcriptional regulator with XRE-family HTH domain